MGQYLEMLKDILFRPKHFQSDFCRYNAALVAEAASRGHISSVVQGAPKGKWFITKAGLEMLEDNNVEVLK